MQSLRIGVFEIRGTARTYSKPRTDTDPLSLNVRLTFCGEIDDGLGTAQGVLSQFDPSPAGEASIVTKGDSASIVPQGLPRDPPRWLLSEVFESCLCVTAETAFDLIRLLAA